MVSEGDSGAAPGAASDRRSVPPLPHALANPTPVAMLGTLLWAVAFLVLLGMHLAGVATPATDAWMWTCLAGVLLGALGYSVFLWQRSAARRGARGSWDGLGD